MRFRRFPRSPVARAAGCLALLASAAPSLGRAAERSALPEHGGLYLADGTVDGGRGEARWGSPPEAARPAWQRLQDEVGVAWAAWRSATGVPSRLLFSKVSAPGTVGSPAAAEAFARAFLERHLELLAPGSAPSDLELVANDSSSGIRTVAFAQRHQGLAVIGGQVSFRFKADHLTAIGSEAFPHPRLPPPRRLAPRADARGRAMAFVADGLVGRAAAATDAAGPFVLPLVDAQGVHYREVYRVDVDRTAPTERWQVYVDAVTAEPLARRSAFAHGRSHLSFNVPRQWPGAERFDGPAAEAYLRLADGSTVVAGPDGSLDYDGSSIAATVSTAGERVAVMNAAGEPATLDVTFVDGETVVWDERADEHTDAQLAAYIHTLLGKAYVRNIAPELAWLDGQLAVHVNLADECNAFSDGETLNFFVGNAHCENTARLADVVYHEFGHAVHYQAIIPGAGAFDIALSEGIADYLSATMTNDPDVGEGFFYDDTPLRRLDPPDHEWRWPEHRGEVHDEGRIIAGTLWDLRKSLVAKLGEAEGVAWTDRLWYEAIRRAPDAPSMYAEVLVADDDDGDLSNGTPNVCEINRAFGAHGLFSIGSDGEQVRLRTDAAGALVDLSLALPSFPQCPVSATASLEWRLADDPDVTGTVAMTADEAGSWRGRLPDAARAEVLEYRVLVAYDTGTTRSLPDNVVDPWYQTYVGPVEPLYCFGDVTSLADWQLGGTASTWTATGAFEGPLAGDPAAPYDEDGLHLTQPGTYLPDGDATATSPMISTAGYNQVRLQYLRWLTVEDGYYDRAVIRADGEEVWSNHASAAMELATFHHVDREWRFHDVDLSEQAEDGAVQVSFELESDEGLEFGGWNVDGLCVVGVGQASACGNGTIDAGEQCDDGNDDDGDDCTSRCVTARLDEGPKVVHPLPIDEDEGCACSTGTARGPGAAVTALGLLVLVGLAARGGSRTDGNTVIAPRGEERERRNTGRISSFSRRGDGVRGRCFRSWDFHHGLLGRRPRRRARGRF